MKSNLMQAFRILRRISVMTYVYSFSIMTVAVVICMSFFCNEPKNKIYKTTEMITNMIYLSGEMTDTVSTGNLVKQETMVEAKEVKDLEAVTEPEVVTETEAVTESEDVSGNEETTKNEVTEVATIADDTSQINNQENNEKFNTTKSALSEQDIPMPVDEYEVLCKIVQAEAGNQDEKGKLLVANVVLNRVDHHVFPDTVTDVVFQDNGGVTQFAPTKNGAYGKAEVTIETMQAVNRALAGEDVSNGALYFKAGNGNTWGTHEYLFSHGNHVFFK